MSDTSSSSSDKTPRNFILSTNVSINEYTIAKMKTPVPELSPGDARELWLALSTKRIHELAAVARTMKWDTDAFYVDLASASPFVCAAEIIFFAHKIFDSPPLDIELRAKVLKSKFDKLKERADSADIKSIELGAGQVASSSVGLAKPSPVDSSSSSSEEEVEQDYHVLPGGTKVSNNEAFSGAIHIRRTAKKPIKNKRFTTCSMSDIASQTRFFTLVSEDQDEMDGVVKRLVAAHHAQKPFTHIATFCYGGGERSGVYDMASLHINHRWTRMHGIIFQSEKFEDIWLDFKPESSHVCVVFDRRHANLKAVKKVAKYFHACGAVVIVANCTTGTKLTEMAKPYVGQCGLLSMASLVLDGLSVSDNHKLSKIFNKRLTRQGSCVFVGWRNGERTFQIVESDMPIPPQ